MKRWSYLIPRLIILGLLILAVWVSSDPLIKYALEKSGADAIGAKVEIGQVRTQLTKGRVYLRDVKIADPRNPMLNMLQAEMAYIQLDPRQLLHREIVIDQGTTSKLRFAAPRTVSGALEGSFAHVPVPRNEKSAVALNNITDLSRSWLDRIQSVTPSTNERSLESVRVSKRLKAKWPREFELRRQKITALQNEIGALRDIVKGKDNSNPLRTGQVQAALDEMTKLHEEVSRLQYDLVNLQKEAMSDRDELIAAKNRDQQSARQVVTTDQVDGQTISQLLLTEWQTRNVDEVLRWFRWFRSTIPDPENDFQPRKQRGWDVALKGVKQKPRLLINSLEIDGAGYLAGQNLNFVGTVNDLTSHPSRHTEPISFHLRALGKQHVIVDCILDRRGEVAADTLNVQCPDLKMESQILGSNSTISVAMGPTQMQAEIAIHMVGDELSGELVFRSSEVLMHVNEIHSLAGGKDTALRVNQDLASVDQFETYVQLSGTIDEPKFEFRSDLGNKFAATMNRLSSERLNRSAASYQNKVDQIVRNELKELDAIIHRNMRELAQILNGESEIISQLKQNVPEDASSIRRIR